MKTKILLFLISFLICASLVAAPGEVKKHLFVVDDTAPADDVLISNRLTNELKAQGKITDDEYQSVLNSEVTKDELNYRMTVVIYYGDAKIIVGDNSPAEYVLLAIDTAKILKEKFDITVGTTLLKSEVTSDDLTELFDSPDDTKHLFVVDDNGPADDVLISVRLINELKEQGKIVGEYQTSLNSEVTKSDLENRMTVVIYNGNAVTVIGDNSPAEYVMLATDAANILKEKFSISPKALLTSEVKYDDLTKLFESTLKKHLFVVDDNSPADDVLISVRLINELKEIGELTGEYHTVLNSEVTKSELNYRMTVVIYNGEARIIVGDNSPAEHVLLATKASNILKENNNIDTGNTLLSSEVTSDDLTKLFEVSQCTDSDGGKNYYVKGTAKASNAAITDECVFEDTEYTADTVPECSGSKCFLYEGYCNGDSSSVKRYSCPKGCKDGACVKEAEEVPVEKETPKLVKEEEPPELPEDIIAEKLDKDKCKVNLDCNDNNPCTSDLCSGTPKSCSHQEALGCAYEDSCIPFGIRVDGSFCDIDKEIKPQVKGDLACNNNYECKTNLCVDSNCLSQGVIQKILNWLKRIFFK